MEGTAIFGYTSSLTNFYSKSQLPENPCSLNFLIPSSSSSSSSFSVSSSSLMSSFLTKYINFRTQKRRSSNSFFCPKASLRNTVLAVGEVVEKSKDTVSTAKEMLPKIDKSGRFCSPRAARELALLVSYAACLEGSDPVRLLEKRMTMRREPGYEFDKASLLEYNHMSFGGPPIATDTAEEADEFLQDDEKESAIEAEVLSAPPKLVYSRLTLRFARKLLVAVVEHWDRHVAVIDKVAPVNWKNAPAGRILELCILHLAMSEITVLGTRHQIVINEAVDLAKRFCDGAAPRIINGCLRTFVMDIQGTQSSRATEAQEEVAVKA